jgi:hypothetical protein
LAEVGAVKLCLRWEPIDQDGAAYAQEHGEHSFADADRESHSCGTSSADKHQILSCLQCCRDHASPESQYRGSGRLVSFEGAQVIAVRVRPFLPQLLASVNMCETQRRK